MANEVTIKVRKGVKVNVEEVEEIAEARERDLHVTADAPLKITVKRLPADPSAGPNTVIMCD